MLLTRKKLIQAVLFSILYWGVAAILSIDGYAVAAELRRPDDRVLWQLFHTGKIAEIKQQIVRLQQRFPGWEPPPELLYLIEQKKNHKQFERSNNIKRRPLSFCQTISQQWQYAEKAAKEHYVEAALVIYRKIIKTCGKNKARETLRRAYAILNYRDFVKIIQFSKAYLPHKFIDNIHYDYLKKDYFSRQISDKSQHNKLVKRLEKWVEKYQDDKLATIFAWQYFKYKDYKLAEEWFNKAYVWNKDNSNAVYGLVLTLEQQHKNSQLLDIISTLKNPSIRIKTVAKRAYIAEAWQAYNRGHLPEALKYADKAKQLTGIDTDILELNAWIARKNKQYQKSARLFFQLYQKSGKEKYAKGYIQSQSHVDRKMLTRRVYQAGGVLLDAYKAFHARELYNRKQFQSAYRLAPSEFPDLVNIDTPYFGIGGGVRNKSGQAGTSRLDIAKLPSLTASYTVKGNHKFSLNVSRVSLFSGGLNSCNSPIGVFPGQNSINKNLPFSLALVQSLVDACNAGGINLKKQKLSDAVELNITYRKDGWFSPFLSLGTTPIGGNVSPEPTFKLGFDQQTDFGYWGIESYSRSVRQSILSYAGTKAPYIEAINNYNHVGPNFKWGRVLRTGLKVSAFYQFNEQWNLFSVVDAAWLHGKNVADNSTASVSMGLGRNFKLSGFDYFSVGPSFNYQHFDKNLSHFTLGHGGYFSPEHYYNIGAGVNFLTNEGKEFILRGRFQAGFQGIKEASSPWFPLIDKSIGSYSSAHSSGEALDFEIKGVWLVSSNFQLGSGVAFRKTNGYQDYSAGLFIRYTLKDRKAVYSTDIPDALFGSFF